MNTIKEIKNTIENPYKITRIQIRPVPLILVNADNYFFVFEGTQIMNWHYLVATYKYETGKWALYRGGCLTGRILRLFCKYLGTEVPEFEYSKYNFSIMAFKNGGELEFNHATEYTGPSKETKKEYYMGDTIRTKIKKDLTPDGIRTSYKNSHVEIVKNKIVKFSLDMLPSSIYYTFYNDFLELQNGEKVYLIRDYDRGGTQLVKQVKIEGETYYYPVDLEGNYREDESFWKNSGLDDKFVRIFAQLDRELPENFDKRRAYYHFYGKKISVSGLRQYLNAEDGNGCQCNRCIGYRIYFKETGKRPHYRGWSEDHYKMIHAGINGSLPTRVQMMVDCDCKACKALRNTVNTKSDLGYKLYNKVYSEKGYDRNLKSYLTVDYLSDICVKPEDIPDQEDATVSDYYWRPKARDFKKIFEHTYSRSFPFYVANFSLRMRYAILHCRINEIEWEDVPEKSHEWLQDVFNTQLKPKCECIMCQKLKSLEKIPMDVFQELILEKVDARAYPTALVGEHFGSWYGSEHSIKDLFDYFNTYVLYGKFCECDRCQSFMDKIKKGKYLPPDELKAPKCPICGGSVHNKDLIYGNAKIASKIQEQGFDRSIKVRTALCCSCYGKFSKEGRKNELLFELKSGEYLTVNNRPCRIKNVVPKKERAEDYEETYKDLVVVIKYGQGELEKVEEVSIEDFSIMSRSFELPKRLRDKVNQRR